jgi:hypothetical protein
MQAEIVSETMKLFSTMTWLLITQEISLQELLKHGAYDSSKFLITDGNTCFIYVCSTDNTISFNLCLTHSVKLKEQRAAGTV